MRGRWTIELIVAQAYPATPLVSGRARFCVSAAHTFEDMVQLMHAVDDVGHTLGLRHGRRTVSGVDELAKTAVEVVNSLS